MRIVIDGRSLTGKPTGVSNFLINAINSLIKNEKVHVVIILHKNIGLEVNKRIIFSHRLEVVKSPFIVFPTSGLLWFILKLPFLVNKLNPDFFWGPGHAVPFFLNKKIKKIVTIHDFVFKYFPKTMSIKSKIENHIYASFSINKSDFIWCVSDYVKAELIKLYPNRKCKIMFVGSGVDFNIFQQKTLSNLERKEILEKYNIESPLILGVGTVEPRKNFEFFLKITSKLIEKNVSILIVGSKGWGGEFEKITSYKNKISITGYVDLDDLVKLYNIANLYISTSLNEGFGLPLLEAAACGCPIVCPHNSAMIELGSNFGNTISGWDENVWAYTILKLLEENKELPNLKYKLQKYDWSQIGKNLILYLNSDNL